jgi:hypothetical protein
LHDPFADKLFGVETETGAFSKHCDKRQLRSAIALAKRVDRIEFREEMADVDGEFRRGHSRDDIGFSKFGEGTPKLTLDVLGVTEPISVFAYANGSDLPGPGIYVLEEMAVQFEVVVQIEAAIRRLFRPDDEKHYLCFLKQLRIGDIEQIYED